MKRLWFALGALVFFFIGNPGFTPNLTARFQSPSPPDVCDCGSICMMHVSCDIPNCNGRLAQEKEPDTNNAAADDSDESL